MKIWDAVDGAERIVLTGHTDPLNDCAVNACAVSPDGMWLVSASQDRTLKIWDAATGIERNTLSGHDSWVNDCSISPDGTWLVSASRDGHLKIWDAATGRERTTLTGHTDSVLGCAVSPDGALIASAGADGTLRIWNAATGSQVSLLVLPGAATAVSFLASTLTVAIGDAAGGVHLAKLVGIDLGPLVVTPARNRSCGDTANAVYIPGSGSVFVYAVFNDWTIMERLGGTTVRATT
jgi:WD40 repeat protein